jgi:signal transduction histidine kinase
MRERVHLCGGQFSAGPLPDRGFRVAAVLPLAGPE